MSSTGQNKVDMSLDAIIKMDRQKKIKTARQQRGGGGGQQRGAIRGGKGVARGRGGGQGVARGRGGSRGGFLGRGAGRGMVKGQGRGRGQAVMRGRGKLVTQGQNRPQQQTTPNRGNKRSRGLTKKGVLASPLKRGGIIQNTRGQLKGRGKLLVKGRKQMVFTNSGKKILQTAKNRATQLQLTSKTKQAAQLLREKELALHNLQQAKLNMQTINKAIQQSSRDAVVNQRRGIPVNTNIQANRGRKKLLTSLMRNSGNAVANQQLVNTNPSRHLVNTSVIISNPAALRTGNMTRGTRGKRWRKKSTQNQGMGNGAQLPVVQVANQNASPIKEESSSVLEQLKMLKPAVPTVYKFQKNVFATSNTGVSLSERFASSSSTEVKEENTMGRKVFM